MTLSAQELPIAKSVLVSIGALPATASDGDVSAAHKAMLEGPNVTEYKSKLVAGGIDPNSAALKTGPNWLTIFGLVGGAVALYLIWKNSQSTKQVSSHQYDEPEDIRPRLRGISKAVGALGTFGRKGALGRHRPRRLSDGVPGTKYEFEPETRLEGHRRKVRR